MIEPRVEVVLGGGLGEAPAHLETLRDAGWRGLVPGRSSWMPGSG